MSRFNIQNYLNVLIVIFFLTVAAGGGVSIWPKFQESKAVENDIKMKKEEIARTDAYLKNLKNLKIRLETDYPDELSKIGSALPSGASLPSLLKFLQESSIQSGLLLKSIDPSADNDPKESGLRELKVRLNAEGSYSSLKNFLSVLENSSRLIETENISFSFGDLSKDKKGNQEKAWSSFGLQIKAFGY